MSANEKADLQIQAGYFGLVPKADPRSIIVSVDLWPESDTRNNQIRALVSFSICKAWFVPLCHIYLKRRITPFNFPGCSQPLFLIVWPLSFLLATLQLSSWYHVCFYVLCSCSSFLVFIEQPSVNCPGFWIIFPIFLSLVNCQHKQPLILIRVM